MPFYVIRRLFDICRFEKRMAVLRHVDFSDIDRKEGEQPVPDKFCDSTTCVISLSIIMLW